MPSDIENDPPISHAIAEGWADFAETVLPSIGGTEHTQACIALFGAMYVLQIPEHVVALRSAEEAALALSTLGAEIDEFMKVHAVAVQ
jgi:hypothetical protein